MATNGSESRNVNQAIRVQLGNERHALRDVERDVAASMGIGFDGRFYRYKTFRYERFSDAISYAELERRRPQYRATVIDAPPWEKPVEPSEQEQRVMAALGITFDGRYYRFDGYRYEQCGDAANYAQSRTREKRP
ncbi:hypothetical protein [Noviherbaspirillum denitrificans]|nr:hypothetical protein [Noviherbaspirillum denitrificans]